VLFQSTAVNFDTALAVPSERCTEKAIYCVHQDKIVELRIFFLQYMRYAKAAVASAIDSASRSTRNNAYCIEIKDTIGTVVLDDLERFSGAQSGVTIARDDDDNDNVCWAVVSANWAADGEAIVSIACMVVDCNTDGVKFYKAGLRLNELGSFLDTAVDFPIKVEAKAPGEEDVPSNSKKMSRDQEVVRSWLSAHKDLEPLVRVRCMRSRFVGLENSPEQGIWAALDDEVFMTKASFAQLKSRDFCVAANEKATRFPHRLLSIRAESAD